jgi:hypothetical protein
MPPQLKTRMLLQKQFHTIVQLQTEQGFSENARQMQS